MRVLFDIIHPADALFFHHPILALQRNGADVLIASRTHRDVTTAILDRLGHVHYPVTKARTGMRLIFELGLRNAALFREARRFKPDVMVGFGAISISQVGWLMGIPTISFYDTEIARAQLAITLPFITEWHVPDSYTGRVPHDRVFRFPGPVRLSYFHPENFRPDRKRALAAGLDINRDNFLLRMVAWSSSHDIGKTGWTPEQRRELVHKLSKVGHVHISAEGDLPGDLESFRYRGDVLDLHHLMAHCRAYIGESATMAAEAALVGVPAIYVIDDYRGYVAQLARKNLVIRTDGTVKGVMGALDKLLVRNPQYWHDLRDKAIRDWINVSDYVVAAIERYRPKAETVAPDKAAAHSNENL